MTTPKPDFKPKSSCPICGGDMPPSKPDVELAILDLEYKGAHRRLLNKLDRSLAELRERVGPEEPAKPGKTL